MPLPSFTISQESKLADIIGDVVGSDLVARRLFNAEVRFTCNVSPDDFVMYQGDFHRIRPVLAYVNASGSIERDYKPVQLVANDDGLNVNNIQWTIEVWVKRSLVTKWTFNAPSADVVLNLASVAPVPATGPNGVTHGARTLFEPVDPEDPATLYQWKDEYGTPVGSPVAIDSVITTAVAEAAATAAATTVTPGIAADYWQAQTPGIVPGDTPGTVKQVFGGVESGEYPAGASLIDGLADAGTVGRLSAKAETAQQGREAIAAVPFDMRGRNPLTGWLHLGAYGAVGDGVEHPLSEFYGTLADAQAAYPDANVLALTESIDRVAMDQAQADAAANGYIIYVADGTYILDRRWVQRAGVSIVGSALTGYFPAINFADSQVVGTTFKLKSGVRDHMVIGDPNAPASPYTPTQKWQRSSLVNMRFDGNRKQCYGPDAYDTANIFFEDLWGINFENVYSYSAGGTGVHIKNCNAVYGKGLIAYSCNRHNLWFEDSADCEISGVSNIGGARASALVLDNCIGVNVTGGFTYNAEPGSGVLIDAIDNVQTTGIRINGAATGTTLALELDRTPRYWLKIGAEIISYTGWTGATSADRTLTGVTRGVNGTTPASYAADVRIEDYGDNLFAGVALINGSVSCNVTGLRSDQTGGPGLYVDATSHGNTIHISQYWAGWGAASDQPGVLVDGNHNTVMVGIHKRTPAAKEHQSVAARLGANARDNLLVMTAHTDYSVTYGSEGARGGNTVIRGGLRGKAVNASDAQAMTSGRYLTTGPSTATVQLAANTEYCVPIVISTSGTINLAAFALEVVGDGASKIRLGIREDSGTGDYPGALLADWGQVSTTVGGGGVGARTQSVSTAVRPGVYWLSMVAQGASSVQPSVRVSQQKRTRVMAGSAANAVGYSGGGVDGQPCAYYQTGVSGALQPTFSGSVQTTRIDPVIAIRAA